MRSRGMAVVVGAIGRGAMNDVRESDAAVGRMGQSGGGHARQDESPSQEARDQ